MGFTASAPPVGRLAEAGAALNLSDAGGVFALELGEAGGVEGFLLGALGAGLFDGFVGEDAGGEEDGGHCWCGGYAQKILFIYDEVATVVAGTVRVSWVSIVSYVMRNAFSNWRE